MLARSGSDLVLTMPLTEIYLKWTGYTSRPTHIQVTGLLPHYMHDDRPTDVIT